MQVSFKFSKSGADKEVEGLDKAKFKEALQNVGCLIDEKYLDEVFKRYDLDGNELIGLEEFKCAARASSHFSSLSIRKELAGIQCHDSIFGISDNLI